MKKFSIYHKNPMIKRYKVLHPISSAQVTRVDAGAVIDLDETVAAAFGDKLELVGEVPADEAATDNTEKTDSEPGNPGSDVDSGSEGSAEEAQPEGDAGAADASSSEAAQ